MKKNQWFRIGLLTLAATVALPAMAQRRKAKTAARSSMTQLTTNKPGHYLIQGKAPAKFDGKWIYLYTTEDQPVDSTRIAGGKFTLERPVAGDGLIARLIIPKAYQLRFIPEEGVIQAPMEENYATGTALNEARAKQEKDLASFTDSYRQRAFAVRKDSTLKDEEKQVKISAIFDELYKELEPRMLAILEAHPSDALGYMALQELLQLPDVSLQQAEAFVARAGQPLREDKKVKLFMGRMRQLAETQPGAMFKDFAGLNDAQQSVRLSDYVGKGHYTLVDFWASWCGPCRREMPNLKKVLEEFGPKGLQIVGTAVWDEMADHLKAVEDLKLPWPQIFNKEEATQLYGINGIPQIILFAPDGKIVARDLRGEEIKTKLTELLQSNGGKL